MARVLRRQRYYGVKFYGRQLGRKLVFISAYLLLPWLLKIEPPARGILLAAGILSIPCAYMWQRAAGKIGSAMDISAAGHDGEGRVAKIIANLPRGWAVLNNLALRVNGPIIQIDHLVLGPAGVYVLETKTQKGRIFASPRHGQWQVSRRGRTRSITNPLEQNETQVEACKKLLNKLGYNIPCRGLVVMTEASVNLGGPIVPLDQLAQHLTEEAGKKPRVVGEGEIHNIARTILKYQVSGRAPWQKWPRHLGNFALTVLLPLLLYLFLLACILSRISLP